MKCCLTVILLLAFAAPLSACGLTGTLKTPPPIWGSDKTATAPGEASSGDDAVTTSPVETVFDDPIEDELGYGASVADTP